MSARRRGTPANARSRVLLSCALLLASAGVALLPGCARLFYANSRAGSAYTIYSDHDDSFLESTNGLVDAIYREYLDLFDLELEEVGTTTIVFEGRSDVVDAAYMPELLGYYLPFFKFIRVDTTPSWTRREPLLKQILLHEIAHHFLISRYPAANDACWLNEGIAGNLEVTVFEGDHFEYVLLNPSLLRAAKREIDSQPLPLAELIDLDWQEFHEPATKQRNYALSWSLVHFLLERHLPSSVPLSRRIGLLLELPADELLALEPAWIEYVRSLDATERLIDLAGDARRGSLARSWAVSMLAEESGADLERVVAALERSLDDDDWFVRSSACVAVLEWSARIGRLALADDDAPPRGPLERVAAIIRDPREPAELRRTVLKAAGDSGDRQFWLPHLIELLDDPDAEIRVAAARALARTPDAKPTVVNPSFWRGEHSAAREREVSEWKAWWEERETARS